MKKYTVIMGSIFIIIGGAIIFYINWKIGIGMFLFMWGNNILNNAGYRYK
jgi:ABC-type uncharacterized transport system permease subunit